MVKNRLYIKGWFVHRAKTTKKETKNAEEWYWKQETDRFRSVRIQSRNSKEESLADLMVTSSEQEGAATTTAATAAGVPRIGQALLPPLALAVVNTHDAEVLDVAEVDAQVVGESKASL